MTYLSRLFCVAGFVSAFGVSLDAQNAIPVDLLKSLDLQQGVIDGVWKRTDDGLRVDARKSGRCVVASDVPSSYDLTVEFTRLTGKDVVALILPVGDVSPALGLSGWKGAAHGLSRIDGLPTKDRKNPTSVKPGTIVNGQRQKIEVSVRAGKGNPSIRASLNGKVLFDWSGAADRLEPNIVMNLPNRGTLGLAGRNGSVLFHRVLLSAVGFKTVMKNPIAPKPLAKKKAASTLKGGLRGGEIDISPLGDKGTTAWEFFNGAAFAIAKQGGVTIARARPGVGSGDRGAFIRGTDFRDGVIELEIKGATQRQKSFLGVVFHALDGKTYEAVYFRPFNFGSSKELNRSHGVQYIAHPKWPWQKLRSQRTGEFESAVTPEPDGGDWFRMRVEIKGNRVKVFVEAAKEASLDVQRLSRRNGGKVGLWFNGIAEYRNLKIVPSE